MPTCIVTDFKNIGETESSLLISDDKQIVNALAMAIAQIELSIHESGQSVDLAMDAFTESSNRLDKVRETLDNCPGEVVGSVSENLDIATQQLQKAIIAFQFFDRLTQRITHVKENLTSVSMIMKEPAQEHSGLWVQLQEKMRTVYSQDQERKLYRILSEQKTGKVTQDDVKSKHEPKYGGTELF